MTKQSPAAHARGQWLGAFAAVLMAAASAPGVVLAHARGRTGSRATPREAQRRAPVIVAVGAMAGDPRARGLLSRALSDAIAQEPSLRLQAGSTAGASLVVTAHVRVLSVQPDAMGALARCDVGVVVSDASGAVRAMFDARRVIRGGGSPDHFDALEQSVVRGAAGGLVRDLVSQMVH